MSTYYFHGLVSGEICCNTCAGYALTTSINRASAGQKTFIGAQDIYAPMTPEEVAYMQYVLETDKICHC